MRVALVDDAAIVRALVLRVATELGHDLVAPVEFALDGETFAPGALGAIDAPPDLVIIDGRLGDPLGARTDAPAIVATRIRELRAAFPSTAIGVIAALGETELVRAAADAGAGYVIPRPILASHLRTTFAAVAGERRPPAS